MELCSLYPRNRHCEIAELSAIINVCGEISSQSVKIQTENPAVAKKFFSLLKKTFGIIGSVTIKNSRKFNKSRMYIVAVNDKEQVAKLLNATGIFNTETGSIEKRINQFVVKSSCCKRAFLRGAFISGGSLSDPEKGYHLEFVNANLQVAQELTELLQKTGLNAKLIGRKTHYVVYVKEGENIVDLLNMMGAHKLLLDLENLRIIKDMRNSVNRIVNCETANLNKIVNASVSQVEDIIFIEQTKGFSYLTVQLEEVAKIRIQNPEASLKEIGAMLNPSVSKSGVNHRLRKISEIADNLRGGLL